MQFVVVRTRTTKNYVSKYQDNKKLYDNANMILTFVPPLTSY